MAKQSFASRARRAALVILPIATFGVFASKVSTRAPHFYPDDPISRAPESQDASKTQPYDQGDIYELVRNLFITAGYKPSGLRAKN